MSDGKQRYAIVGLGGRHEMFATALTRTYADAHELAAVCDTNEGRVQKAVRELASSGVAVKAYAAADFDRMVAECRPDCVIVTTMDAAHDAYICRAMELGCDVITEKPMTIDEVRCRRIIETQRRTGRKCTVTFNYRYSPPRTQVKDILMSGAIGNVLSVDFQWLLDTLHGADYYRRWHRNKANSGSLLIHKATHHFDLVNWWLSDIPVTVFAMGTRSFYTEETAGRYGLARHGRRCLRCIQAERCPFHLNLRNGKELEALYLANESFDGYCRDQCVFKPEKGKTFKPAVDIEDSMGALVKYAKGTILTYSLFSYSPWEGYIINFNGTKGRLQHRLCESSYVNSDGTTPGEIVKKGSSIEVLPHRAAPYAPELWKARGGHGGADPVMLEHIFAPEKQPADKYLRAADQRSGAYSILCGVAANRSILNGKAVKIDDLVPDIGMPDYPPMPTAAEPLPLPPPKG